VVPLALAAVAFRLSLVGTVRVLASAPTVNAVLGRCVVVRASRVLFKVAFTAGGADQLPDLDAIILTPIGD
jgi:hypothetical protein